MTVELGTFARRSIETRLGSNLRLGVLAALFHYTRRLRSGKPPVAPPDFYPETPVGEGGASFELQVGPEMLAALEGNAREHRLPLKRILTHAVFVYLADLESTPFSNGSASPPLH